MGIPLLSLSLSRGGMEDFETDRALHVFQNNSSNKNMQEPELQLYPELMLCCRSSWDRKRCHELIDLIE